MILIADMVFDFERNADPPPEPNSLDIQIRLLSVYTMHCETVFPEIVQSLQIPAQQIVSHMHDLTLAFVFVVFHLVK